MEGNEQKVYQVLDSLSINYDKYSHEPVYTVEELEEEVEGVNASICKNLFLRNNKGNKHYLVVLTGEKNVDLKQLASKIESSRLSFASERRLHKYLKLDKGAVSPFGAINDEENHVEIIIDKDISDDKNIVLHPNVNTASIVLNSKDLISFLEWSGNKFSYIDLN
ncbi:prolyl-tRNA synthetase associated domain-containing protein [Natranaerofaba carboxydovora]|uniref:prolyl-tRNA synthetase associated domain-containing protein n=1 Tax=Natranaerofaba carboxydovora TaxID=2742683 RepID=UPI001F13224F|nr:YbaK/EbsC family protein [Natranaerofaba carboxydovora]UMZ73638.1 Prolyl-tRNA editing protein ProX [Natranaerofaba carboxydovora]